MSDAKKVAQHAADDAADDCVIEIFQLTRRFDAFTVVDRVSLVGPYGGSFGLLGLNDAGKNTLIKMPAELSEGMARVVAAARFCLGP